MNNRTYEFNYDGTVTSAGTVTNTKTYEFDYEETVTSAGTVAGRLVSYDIVFSDPVPTDNASLITSGTLSDARLSSNVPLKNTANIFTQNQTINGDVEVTDSTKGIILKSGNNTRWRITITDSGTLQRVALSILAALAIVSSSTAQTVTDVVVGTNGVLVAPTNFFTANLPNWSTSTNPAQARTNLGLGSAATNDGSAFQPSSANLTNLASNNAINLTNFPALLLRTNGSAAGMTNFPTLNQNTTGTASNVTGVVALANGGTGASNATNARTNLGLGTAATNASTDFQPASVNLTNLASNNAINLTNFPASLLRTNGSAAGLTSFPTFNQNTTGTASNVTGVVAITNGGTGTNTAGGARTNLGLGATWLTNTNSANFRSAIGLGSWAELNDGANIRVHTLNISDGEQPEYIEFGLGGVTFNGGADVQFRSALRIPGIWLTATNVTNFRTDIGLGVTNSVTFSNIIATGTLGVSNTAAFATNVTVAGNLTVKSLVTSDPVNIILDATQTSAATNGVLTLPDNANLIRLTNNNAISAVTNGRLGSFYYLVNQVTNGTSVTLSNVGGIVIDGGADLTLAPNESATLVALGPTNISVAARADLNNVTLGGTANTAPQQTASSDASLMTRGIVYQSQADFNSGDPVGVIAINQVGTGASSAQYAVLGWGSAVTTNTNTAAGTYFGEATWTQSSFSGGTMPANKAVDLTMKGVMLRVETNTNFVSRVLFGVGAPGRTPPAAGNPAATNQSWGVNFFYNGTNHVYQPFWYTTNYNTAPTAVITNLNASSWLGRVYTMRFQQTTNGQISFYINDGLAGRLASTPTWTTNVTWPSVNYGGRYIGMECATATNAAPATGARIHYRIAYLRYDP